MSKQCCFFDFFTQVQKIGTERVDYPPNVNSIIEAAFKKEKKQVEFETRDGLYVIDFKEMVEYPKIDRQSQVAVSRRINVKGLSSFFVLQQFEVIKLC